MADKKDVKVEQVKKPSGETETSKTERKVQPVADPTAKPRPVNDGQSVPFLQSPMKMGGAAAAVLGGFYVLRTVMRK